MTPGDPLESTVRLFLSVDIVGSTSLKSRINSSVLYDRLNQATEEITQVLKDPKVTHSLTEDEIRDFVVDRIPRTDWDWTYVFDLILNDFHKGFLRQVEKETKLSPESLEKIVPWKLIGDELVYNVPVPSISEIHEMVKSFLAALVNLDKESGEKHKGLRLKGSGWVAGFPVRNAEFPIPGNEKECDYLGPDIDIGFRLGKHSRSGMFVASTDLVELLGRIEPEKHPQLKGVLVGWEELKGVWNEEPYPIIWLKLPSEPTVHNLESKEGYFPFREWEKESDPLIKKWCMESHPQPVGNLLETIDRVRESLSDSLGLFSPYLVSEGDTIPEKHQTIKGVLKRFKPKDADQESGDIQSESLDRIKESLKEDKDH